MGWLRLLLLLRARLHALIHRDVVAGEIREELEFHVEMRTAEYERAGAPPSDAARRARTRVGNLAVTQDRGYDIRGGGVMETVLQDVRYGVRLLWKQRGFSCVVVGTLALGIGLSTALASVIDAAMLHPIPYPHPEELVDVTIASPQRNGSVFNLGPSLDDRSLLAGSGSVFVDLAVWRSISTPPIAEGATPERLPGMEVTDGFFHLYGVAPLLGRVIESAALLPGAPPVVVLGYDYWKRRYASQPEVLGQAIRFDVGTATIVGVLPERFEPATPIYRPLVATPLMKQVRGSGSHTTGRLPAGLALDRAQRELTDVLDREPGARPGQGVVLQSLAGYTIERYRTTVNILAGAVALILLLACVNVASLLLARGATRVPELAVRASIGAGRRRLVRQLLTESLLLAFAGGLAGVLLAWWSLDLLVANIPATLPSDVPVTLSWRVLGWSAALSVATGLLCGLAPALRLSHVGITTGLAHGSRSAGASLSRRGSQILIGAETALAVVLLVGAGLMIRSFDRLLSVDLGFDPGAFITLEAQTIDPSPATTGQYYPALVEAIRGLPGVGAVGAVDHLPLDGSSGGTSATTDDGASLGVHVLKVVPGYFEAVGVPLRQGRLPTDVDRTAGRTVVALNESAAKKLFPNTAPLGRRLTLATAETRQAEVVGVVGDVRIRPDTPPQPEVYQLYRPLDDQYPPRRLMVVVRPSGRAGALPALLRQAAESVGPRVIVDRIRTGNAWLAFTVTTPRRRTVLLGLLGGLGLVLALVGVFGTTMYAVARRTREIGVRMAFGATPGGVTTTMTRDAAVPVGLGIAVGLGSAVIATRVIATFLFETTPTDPETFATAAVALGAAACLAAWIPARRAARVDPVRALRAE